MYFDYQTYTFVCELLFFVNEYHRIAVEILGIANELVKFAYHLSSLAYELENFAYELSNFADDITSFAYDPQKREHLLRHIHPTTKLVKWKVVGVDPGFDNSSPLDPSGNAIGPFVVGQVVQVVTEVSKNVGTRTSAVRTITIETPIG